MIRLPALVICLMLVACSSEPGTPSQAGKPGNGDNRQASDWSHGAMVSAANPHAVAAAIAVLERGGHAVDAAIAAHAVLGLVEPESSGIGGSAFMIVYDRASDSTVVFDGREMAPGGASQDMFMRDGELLGGRDKWALGVSVGVPGAVSLYDAAHTSYGRLDWTQLFQPAIELAIGGFEVTTKFVTYNNALMPTISTGQFPNAGTYLFPNGAPLRAGQRITNAAYARTLASIAEDGAQAFYEGDIAAAIVARVQAEPSGGSLSMADLANYKTIKREPVCGAFRANTICSVPPPSSGVVHVMIPALYDELLSGDEATVEEKVRVFVDAQRLAYADRDHFVADGDFVDVPIDALIDPDYIRRRAAERFAPDAVPEHGEPAPVALDEAARLRGDDRTVEAVGTSHLSIIDADGNAVSMTASVGYPYGSVRMVEGFFLNNELTDFSTDTNSSPAANAIVPGKRPRSSMSPTIVFDTDGEPMLLTGSSGGSSILAYTTKTILAILDWGMSPQQAADFPNVVARGENVGVEVSAAGGEAIAESLTDAGYRVQEGRGENSGLHIILVGPDGMQGAADARRHGTVEALPR